MTACLKKAFKNEKSELVQDIYSLFKINLKIAKEKQIPLCQDTGTAVVFIEKGDKLDLPDTDLIEAIQKGVRQGYKKHFLRTSIVKDPFQRENTKDNTPAIIHIENKRGNSLKITLLIKGSGAENCSRLAMFKPSDGYKACLDFIVETVKKAGGKGCPPYIVGVGIGGNFEKCAYLAKKSLLRNLTKPNQDKFYNKMEKEALKRINELGIGAQGFGGKITALAVSINSAPCHIASLPIAVNIECAMHRHATIVIQ